MGIHDLGHRLDAKHVVADIADIDDGVVRVSLGDDLVQFTTDAIRS